MDPVVRLEVLDILREFVQDDEHSVFISSHITSDLEQVCDHVTFIHEGRIVLCEQSDKLLEEYKVVRCKKDYISKISQDDIVGSRENRFGYELLVKNLKISEHSDNDIVFDNAKLEDIMTFYIRSDGE